MGRKTVGKKPMTGAERARRWRAKRKQAATSKTSNARGNEWGTPPDIIAAVRKVLGDIDCDPATHAAAQDRVQARYCYTADDDGLAGKWFGRVFLNPPYGRGLIDRFAVKLLVEFTAGRTTEAIVLVNAQTDTAWFGSLMDAATAWCFPAGRIVFLNTDGGPGRPQVGQAILYFGRNPQRFVAVFSHFGNTNWVSPGDAKVHKLAVV